MNESSSAPSQINLTRSIETHSSNNVSEVISMESHEKPFKITKKQVGQWKRANITIVHGTVRACGHKAKFSATKTPSTNCVSCWTAYYATCVDLESVHKLLTEQGVKELIKKYGKRFVINFRGFLSLTLKPKDAVEESNEP
jgi:hypothetical protein